MGAARASAGPQEIWALGGVVEDFAVAPAATGCCSIRNGAAQRRHRFRSTVGLRGAARVGDAVLAGGLDAGNARAAAAVGAFALDVSSGVERSPGRKDAGRMHAFFEALRAPKRGASAPC